MPRFRSPLLTILALIAACEGKALVDNNNNGNQGGAGGAESNMGPGGTNGPAGSFGTSTGTSTAGAFSGAGSIGSAGHNLAGAGGFIDSGSGGEGGVASAAEGGVLCDSGICGSAADAGPSSCTPPAPFRPTTSCVGSADGDLCGLRCYDAQGHELAASCFGHDCRCLYDGQEFCRCSGSLVGHTASDAALQTCTTCCTW
jgi:hypothetical protein